MRSTLEAFLKVVKDLKAFADSMEPVYSELALHKNKVIRDCLTVRRRLDYSAFVVALYSAFEKLIEDLVWSHTELEMSRYKYDDLPKALRDKHLRVSAGLLSRKLGEGRYAELVPGDIVANLYACLSGQETYSLNRHAVIHHDANLQSKEVQAIFTALGVENINALALRTEPMESWFSQKDGREVAPMGPIPSTLIDHRLKELVERRNQIAHSGGAPYEALAAEAMHSQLAFLEAYSRSLFNILAGRYLERYYVKSGRAEALGPPVSDPYKGGSVIVVGKPACRIHVGQAILGMRAGHVDRWGDVTEIQVDDVSVPSVETEADVTEVGLRANFKFTRGIQLYLLEHKDEVVWG